MELLRELCTEDVGRIEPAIRAGARRVELCADLYIGGVTPSSDRIREAVGMCAPWGVPVMVIVRPRGGTFEYSPEEVNEMCASVNVARELGVSGVVFGALNSDGWIDEAATIRLLGASAGLSRTFHMAFDHIPATLQRKAIDWLASHGFDRVLTHGSSSGGPIEPNLDTLAQYVKHADGRIGIMPGGGVTHENAAAIAAYLGVNEVHGTRIVPI